jgi:hypothetical protein
MSDSIEGRGRREQGSPATANSALVTLVARSRRYTVVRRSGGAAGTEVRPRPGAAEAGDAVVGTARQQQPAMPLACEMNSKRASNLSTRA